MPLTAKLSRRFYEKFGDEIVNELVELLNRVDTAYRTELREQNELNYARFDAKLEQRIAELGAALRGEMAEMVRSLRAEIAQQGTLLRAEISSLKVEVHALKAELIKWMFLFWSVTVLLGYLLK
jgi:hypothetical protein